MIMMIMISADHNHLKKSAFLLSKSYIVHRTSYINPLPLHAMKILMVCLGNICRSPLAEGILEHKAREAGLDWTIESAGTNGYHTGEAPHHLSQKVALLNGINICH